MRLDRFGYEYSSGARSVKRGERVFAEHNHFSLKVQMVVQYKKLYYLADLTLKADIQTIIPRMQIYSIPRMSQWKPRIDIYIDWK